MGFLYTNKESISLGIVAGIDTLSKEAPEILEWHYPGGGSGVQFRFG